MNSDIIITIKKISSTKEPIKETRFEKWMRLLSASDIAEMEQIAKGDEIMEELVGYVKRDLSKIDTLDESL